MTPNFEMTKPVDRMYAILGIAGFGPSAHPDLCISYTEPASSVYRIFNKYRLENDNSIAAMLFAEGPLSVDPPSWSPDWSKKSEDKAPLPLTFTRDCDRHDDRDMVHRGWPNPSSFLSQLWHNTYAFRAGSFFRQLEVSFTPDGHVLRMRGLLVDSITDIELLFEAADMEALDLDEKMGLWQEYDSITRAWLNGI